MKELKCPQCGNVFSVDEADYAFILNQVKTHEFEAELKARLSEIQQQNKAQQETETLKITQSYQGKLNEKEVELSKKESTIAQLQAQINAFNQAKTLALEAYPWHFLSVMIKARQFLLFGKGMNYLKPDFSLGIKYNW